MPTCITQTSAHVAAGQVRNIFELVKVAKMNNLLTRNALNQLKHCHACAI